MESKLRRGLVKVKRGRVSRLMVAGAKDEYGEKEKGKTEEKKAKRKKDTALPGEEVKETVKRGRESKETREKEIE